GGPPPRDLHPLRHPPLLGAGRGALRPGPAQAHPARGRCHRGGRRGRPRDRAERAGRQIVERSRAAPGGGLPVIAIIGLALGLVLGVVVQPDVPARLQPYLPIAVVAALDTLAGGLRASLDGAFDSHVFITSFLFNVLIAAFLVFLGDQLGVGSQLSTAVIVV